MLIITCIIPYLFHARLLDAKGDVDIGAKHELQPQWRAKLRSDVATEYALLQSDSHHGLWSMLHLISGSTRF
jgi:hypothetical protein